MLLLKKWRVRGGVFLVPLALALVISFRGYIKRTGRFHAPAKEEERKSLQD